MKHHHLIRLLAILAATSAVGACSSAQIKETAQYTAAAVFLVALEVHEAKNEDEPEYKPGQDATCGRSCSQREDSPSDELAEELFSAISERRRHRQTIEFNAFMDELQAAEKLTADEILLKVAPQ